MTAHAGWSLAMKWPSSLRAWSVNTRRTAMTAAGNQVVIRKDKK